MPIKSELFRDSENEVKMVKKECKSHSPSPLKRFLFDFTDHPGGNYMKEAIKRSLTVKEGEFRPVIVRHDEWCNLLAGTGPCNCDPEIEEIVQNWG